MFAYSQPNAGPSAARNRGIRFSRGRLVSFFDSDDLLMPDYLVQMSAALESDPRNGMAYTDGWSFDHRTKKIHITSAMSGADAPERPPTDHAELYALLVRQNFMLSAAMVRREVLIEVGGYDETDEVRRGLRPLAADRRRGLPRSARRREARAPARARRLRSPRTRPACSPRSRSCCAGSPPTPPPRRGSPPWRASARRTGARRLGAETGEDRRGAAVKRARGAAARVLRRSGRNRAAYDEPPPEVAAAFPDLERL